MYYFIAFIKHINIFYVNSIYRIKKKFNYRILVKNLKVKIVKIILSFFSNAFVSKIFYIIGKNDKSVDCLLRLTSHWDVKQVLFLFNN